MAHKTSEDPFQDLDILRNDNILDNHECTTIASKSVRKWELKKFKNAARSDEFELLHWRHVDSVQYNSQNPYPFAFSSKLKYAPRIDEHLYKKFFKDNNWSFDVTNYFLDCCKHFELNFNVILDRILTKYPELNIDLLDLKARYFNICQIYNRISSGKVEITKFDFNYEYETQKRYNLDKYQRQTHEELENEYNSKNQLKIIEIEQTTKLKTESIEHDSDEESSSVDETTEFLSPTEYNQEINVKNLENGYEHPPFPPKQIPRQLPNKKMVRLPPKKTTSHPETTITPVNPINKIFNTYNKIYQLYKFPDTTAVGTSLRSQRHKIPQNVGTRRIKALNYALYQMGYVVGLPATVEIGDIFCNLRSYLIGLYDLKHALVSLEFEYQKLKQKFVNTYPDIPLPFPEELKTFDVTLIDDPPIKNPNNTSI